jgi:hypothetical protein
MPAVTRLVTFVDLRAEHLHQVSFSARHEAVLSDRRRVLLLDDRGWTSSALIAVGPDGTRSKSGASWDGTSVEEIEETARIVVCPDEAANEDSQEDAEIAHWDHLARVLRREGITADAADLKLLPHEVVLSERLLSKIVKP